MGGGPSASATLAVPLGELLRNKLAAIPERKRREFLTFFAAHDSEMNGYCSNFTCHSPVDNGEAEECSRNLWTNAG